MAAIHPDTTDYYFYALNDSGTHTFFETYMDQQDFLNGKTSDAEDTAEPDTAEDAENTADDAADDGEEPYYQETITNEDGEEEKVNAQ